MLAASAFWWVAVLAAQLATGSAPHWAIAPGRAHALLMSFSFMPMFFAGFLFTAGPRWLGLAPVSARRLLPMAVAWLPGWGLFLAGVHLDPALAAAGLALVAASWSLFVWRLLALVRRGTGTERTHLRLIAGACAAGAAALWSAATGTVTGDDALQGAALAAGVWWFLAPVFVIALHRMAPFLGSAVPRLDERHPLWLLAALLGAALLQPALGWALARDDAALPWAALALALDTAAAALVLGLVLRWRRLQNLRIRLLGMLATGLAWLGLAFALQAAGAAQAWAGLDARGTGFAAVHALAMGFFGSIQFAFVSRVSAGRMGRPHAIDATAWALFLVLQAAIVLRIAAAWWPGQPMLLLAAAAPWAAAMIAWSARHVDWYGRPRLDGRPG